MASGFGRLMAVALLTTGLGLLTTSCGMGKVADCNKFIGEVNNQQELVKKATAKLQGSHSPSDMENIATTFENQAKALAGVELKDEKLKQYSKEYQEALNRWAKEFREAAAAQRSKDIGRLNKANTAIQSVGPEEAKIVNNINNYCQGH